MNSSNKKPFFPRGVPQPFTQRAGHKPQSPPVYKPQPASKIAQPKIAAVPAKAHTPVQNVRKPIASPVYRPQPAHTGVQAKFTGPTQIKKQPAAVPPVSRPQPLPKILQPKMAM